MLVGITYDLQDEYIKMGFSPEEAGEFDKADTIEAIDDSLRKNAYETERIGNVKQLVQKLAEGKRWDIVFNICEGVYGIGREAQVPALLDAYKIPYTFSDPLVLSLTLHKGMTKHVIKQFGIPTADYIVANSLIDIENIKLPFPLFVKPVSEGSGKGINASSRVKDKTELIDVTRYVLENFNQPALIETFLPGREFTTAIIGTGKDARVIGTMEILFKDHIKDPFYSYFNKENYQGILDYELVKDKAAEDSCSEVALAAWQALGCRDAGRIDLKMDENNIPNFIEVNPLAGLRPIHSDLIIIAGLKGICYSELIGNIMQQAIKRVGLK